MQSAHIGMQTSSDAEQAYLEREMVSHCYQCHFHINFVWHNGMTGWTRLEHAFSSCTHMPELHFTCGICSIASINRSFGPTVPLQSDSTASQLLNNGLALQPSQTCHDETGSGRTAEQGSSCKGHTSWKRHKRYKNVFCIAQMTLHLPDQPICLQEI